MCNRFVLFFPFDACSLAYWLLASTWTKIRAHRNDDPPAYRRRLDCDIFSLNVA